MSPALLPLAAYLLGSIPFSYLVVRLLCGRDIREVGSGNAGATNVLRAAGLPAALSVLALDVLKGMLPVALALRLEAPALTAGLAAVAAVAGHIYPIYLGFRGGKGVATTLGALAGLALAPTAVAVAVLLALVAWKRYVSLGSIVGVSLAPLLMLGAGTDLRFVGAAAAAAVLVVARHADNIRRLRAGTERRLGEPAEIA